MEKKSIKLNYIYNVAYQILLLVVPLVTTPYISRVLGADGVGTYSFANSVTSYFVLFAALGTAIYGQREISYLQNDRKRRSKVFWETELLSIISTIVCLALYLIYVFFQDRNQMLYICLAFNIVAVSADITWLFQGMEEFGKIIFRNFAFKILNIIYIFIFIRTKNDLIHYIFGISFLLLLNNLSLWLYLPQFVDKPIFKELSPFRNLRTVISLFVPTVAIHIYTVLDKTMLGLFTANSYENGYYEQALKISKMVLTIITAFGTVMVPRIGYHFEHKELPVIQELLYRSYTFVWFLSIPLCFGLIGISGNFVPWFFGDGFGKVSDLLCILSFLIPAIGISNVTGMQYLVPTKRQKLLTLTVLIGTGVNLVLNFLLIPRLYSIGAAIASITAETTITFVQLFIVRREFSIARVFKCSVHYFWAGGIMGTILLLESRYLSSGLLHTCLMIISGATIYFGVLFFIRDSFLMENVNNIVNRNH